MTRHKLIKTINLIHRSRYNLELMEWICIENTQSIDKSYFFEDRKIIKIIEKIEAVIINNFSAVYSEFLSWRRDIINMLLFMHSNFTSPGPVDFLSNRSMELNGCIDESTHIFRESLFNIINKTQS